MNNEHSLSKILYKNPLGGTNFYTHSDFTTSDSFKLNSSYLDKLGFAAPVYCNPVDRSIYSAIKINTSSLKFTRSITKEIVDQTDYLLCEPIVNYINTRRTKSLNRVFFISLTPDIHNSVVHQLESSKVFFLNTPSIFTQLVNLKFSRDSFKYKLIHSCFDQFDELKPKDQDLSLTLLSGNQAMNSAEICKHQGPNVLFSLVGIDNWINSNFSKKDYTNDDFNRMIQTYNDILKNLELLSNESKCQVLLADQKFDVRINESISIQVNPEKNLDKTKMVLDNTLAKTIKKMWREKTSKSLLNKFDL